jgi:flagellar basal-body rod modification protein FlgD
LDASIDLPEGAAGIKINVHDAKGNLVQELIAGPQMPGTTPIKWDGKDAMGTPAPTGLYRLTAEAVINGNTAKVAVNALTTVKSIVTNPSDGSVSVEVDGGKVILLTDVKRVGM